MYHYQLCLGRSKDSWVQYYSSAWVSCWTLKIPDFPHAIQLTLCKGKKKSAHHTTNFQFTENCSWVYKDQSNCKLCRYLYRPSSVCLYLQASKMNHTYSSEFLHRKSPSITSKEGMMTFPPAFTHTVSVFYQISNFQQLRSKRPETLEKPNNIFVKFPLKINIIGFSRCKKSPLHMLPRINSRFRYSSNFQVYRRSFTISLET